MSNIHLLILQVLNLGVFHAFEGVVFVMCCFMLVMYFFKRDR